MAQIVVTAVILVALAVLIILNVGYTSQVDLFGARFQNVSVIVIAIAGFVLGLVYAVVLYVVTQLKRRRRTSERARRQGLEERETQLAAREQTAGQDGAVESAAPKGGRRRRSAPEESAATGAVGAADAGLPAPAKPAPSGQAPGSRLLGLFRGRRGR